MAKDTFILRTEWHDAISELSNEEKGIILDNLFFYHSEQENLINLNNLSVKLVWKFIAPNLKRNADSYDNRKLTSSENGKKGGRPSKKDEINLNNLNSEPNLTKEPNESLSVLVTVPVIDIVPESVNELEIKLSSAIADGDFLKETLKGQEETIGELESELSSKDLALADFQKKLKWAEDQVKTLLAKKENVAPKEKEPKLRKDGKPKQIYWDKLLKCFSMWYNDYTQGHENYLFKDVDYSALREIVQNLRARQDETLWTEEFAIAKLTTFLKLATFDGLCKKSMKLPIINTQYQPIILLSHLPKDEYGQPITTTATTSNSRRSLNRPDSAASMQQVFDNLS